MANGRVPAVRVWLVATWAITILLVAAVVWYLYTYERNRLRR